MTVQPDTALRERVLDTMRGLLPGILNREVATIAESTGLMDELGLRSTTTLELLLGLEENLGIEIDVEDIDTEDLSSVGDLADFVATHTIS